MSEAFKNPVEEFVEYTSSIGTIINHVEGFYIVRLFDGRIVGIPGLKNPIKEDFESCAATFVKNNHLNE